jgi:hypothetical protein
MHPLLRLTNDHKAAGKMAAWWLHPDDMAHHNQIDEIQLRKLK